MAPVTLARGGITAAEWPQGNHQGPALGSPELSRADRGVVSDGDQSRLNDDTPGQDSQHCVAPSLRKAWWQTVLAPAISSMSVLEQDALAHYPPPHEAGSKNTHTLEEIADAQSSEGPANNNTPPPPPPPPPVIHFEPPEPLAHLTPILDRIRAHDGDRASSMEINSMRGKIPPGPIVDGCLLCQQKYSVAFVTALLSLLDQFRMQSAGREGMSGVPQPPAAAHDGLPSPQPSDIDQPGQPSMDDASHPPHLHTPLASQQQQQQHHHHHPIHYEVVVDIQTTEAQTKPNSVESDESSIDDVINDMVINYDEHHEENSLSDLAPLQPSIEFDHKSDSALSSHEDSLDTESTSEDGISWKHKHADAIPALNDHMSQVSPEHHNERFYVGSPALHDWERAAVAREPAKVRLSVWTLDLDSLTSESANRFPSPVSSLPPGSASNESRNASPRPKGFLYPVLGSEPSISADSVPSPSIPSAAWRSTPESLELHGPEGVALVVSQPITFSDSDLDESTDPILPGNRSPSPEYSSPPYSGSVVSIGLVSSPRRQSRTGRPASTLHHPTLSRRSSSLSSLATSAPDFEPNVDPPCEKTEPLRRSKRKRISRITFSPSELSKVSPQPKSDGPPPKRLRVGRGRSRVEAYRLAEPVKDSEPPILDEIHVKGEYIRTAQSEYPREFDQRTSTIGASTKLSELGEGHGDEGDADGREPPRTKGYLADLPVSTGSVGRPWRLRGTLRVTGL